MIDVDERELVKVLMSSQLENIKLRSELKSKKEECWLWYCEWKKLKAKYEGIEVEEHDG